MSLATRAIWRNRVGAGSRDDDLLGDAAIIARIYHVWPKPKIQVGNILHEAYSSCWR